MSKLSFTVFAIGAAALSSMAGAETANATVPGSIIAAPLASAAKSPVTKVQYGRYGYGGYGGYGYGYGGYGGYGGGGGCGGYSRCESGGWNGGWGRDWGGVLRIRPGLWRWLLRRRLQ